MRAELRAGGEEAKRDRVGVEGVSTGRDRRAERDQVAVGILDQRGMAVQAADLRRELRRIEEHRRTIGPAGDRNRRGVGPPGGPGVDAGDLHAALEQPMLAEPSMMGERT